MFDGFFNYFKKGIEMNLKEEELVYLDDSITYRYKLDIWPSK